MSKKKQLFDSTFDPLDQLSLLREKCNNITPHLYRVNSFYLEEIRNSLPQTIKTSLFSLITDRIGDDFGLSTVSSRKRFQLEIDKLVSDNISLITIEHLNELAKKIDEENIRQLNNAKDEISNASNIKNDSERSESFKSANSINISSTPPLEKLSITEGWNGELKAPYTVDDKETYLKSKISENDDPINNINNEHHSLKDDVNNSDDFKLRSKDIEILQSIFALTDESNLSDLDSKIADSHNYTCLLYTS